MGIHVGDGNHLRKINDSDFTIVVDHYVELVEITMNKAVASQLYDQFHQFVVHGTRIIQLLNLTSNKT